MMRIMKIAKIMMMMMRIYGETNSQNETTINQYYSRHRTKPENASRRQEVNGWGGSKGKGSVYKVFRENER